MGRVRVRERLSWHPRIAPRRKGYSMIIRDFGSIAKSDARVIFATVSWEDCEHPDHELIFETRGEGLDPAADGPCADAFLAACFPLAIAHGESRVRIEGQPCPMLVEGLYTAHAWWTS